VIRVANSGISSVSDSSGRIVAMLALGETGHVDAALPLAAPPTLFWIYGNLMFFAPAFALLLLGLAIPRR
jgi:apolipoprotein N-acyltransferase